MLVCFYYVEHSRILQERSPKGKRCAQLSWVFRFLKFRSRGPNRNRNSGSVGIPLRSAGTKSIPAGINVTFLTGIGTIIPPESGMLPEYFVL